MRYVLLLAVLLIAWMNAYEQIPGSGLHRNRLTGVVCHFSESCWLKGWY